jgi:translation initiation factor 2 subunit 2
MEAVLRSYIMEYVTCKTCKSPDTLLEKDNRLFFVTCQSFVSLLELVPR